MSYHIVTLADIMKKRRKNNERTIQYKRNTRKRPHTPQKLQHDQQNRRRKPLQYTNHLPQNTHPKQKHRNTIRQHNQTNHTTKTNRKHPIR